MLEQSGGGVVKLASSLKKILRVSSIPGHTIDSKETSARYSSEIDGAGLPKTVWRESVKVGDLVKPLTACGGLPGETRCDSAIILNVEHSHDETVEVANFEYATIEV